MDQEHNIINIDKIDSEAKNKNDDISFAGSVDTIPIMRDEIQELNLKQSIHPSKIVTSLERTETLQSNLMKNQSEIQKSLVFFQKTGRKSQIKKSMHGKGEIIINSISDIVLNKNLGSINDGKEIQNKNDIDDEYSIALYGNMSMETPNMSNQDTEAIQFEGTGIQMKFSYFMNYKKGSESNFVNVNIEDSSNYSKIQMVIEQLSEFARAFYDFLKFGQLIQKQFNKFIKPISFKSFIVYVILQQIKEKDIFDEESLIDYVSTLLTYQNIEKMLPEYENAIIEKFIQGFKDKSVIISSTYFSDKGAKYLNLFRKFEILKDFTIGNDIERIIHSIMNNIYIPISSNLINTFNKDATGHHMASSITTSSLNQIKLQESITEKLIQEKKLNYSQAQMIYFYNLLLKINEFYKNTFLTCCEKKTNDEINYFKSPYVFCYDCNMLVCIKCFRDHREHNYFDFCCTVKKKIGNIHSNPSIFLNYSQNGNEAHQPYVEDLILDNILLALPESRFKRLLTSIDKNKSIHYSIFDFIDVFLVEFLYKEIYPLSDDVNNEYLKYYLSCLKKTNLFKMIMKESMKENEDIYDNIIEQLQHEEKKKWKLECCEKMQNIVNYDSYANQFIDISYNQLQMDSKKGNDNSDIKSKLYISEEYKYLIIDQDLEIPIEKYQKYLDKYKSSIIKSTERTTTEGLKISSAGKKQIKNSSFIIGNKPDNKSLIQSFIENDIKRNLDGSNEYAKTKWYRIVFDQHELIYKYKYFDGFGSLLGYTKVYLDNILNDITNFGSSFVEFTNKNRKNLP